MDGPDSSYSLFSIHICWKVAREDKMEPPIHTEYFLSGGATTLIFDAAGASPVTSLLTLSEISEGKHAKKHRQPQQHNLSSPSHNQISRYAHTNTLLHQGSIHSRVNMVVPPDRTMFEYNSFLMSKSHIMMELKQVPAIPSPSSNPSREGLNSTSGHLNCSSPMLTTCINRRQRRQTKTW